MPGIPLVARQASSYSRSTQQMCRQDSHMQSPVEEEIASEESLSIYCKPVEFYNIIQRRATRNPTFLQRCLRYKIQAKHKKRIRLTLSVSELVNGGLHANNQFPFYVLLGRHISNNAVRENSFNYSFNRVCILTSIGEGRNMEVHANFVLPDANNFASEAKYRSLSILIFSCGSGLLASKDHSNMTSTLLDAGQPYLCGSIPLEELYLSWDKSIPFSLGYRAEVTSTIDMHSCLLKWDCSNKGKFVTVHIPSNSGNMTQQVKVNIFVEEIGTVDESPYNSYLNNDIPASSLSQIIRLRAGNVIFNYRSYNNKLQRTEVTEDFTCPFCLVKCASFKGLRYHLSSSHDLFNFEFWVTEEYQAVNVSVKSNIWKYEIVGHGVYPKKQTFFICSRRLRRRKFNLLQNGDYSHALCLESDSPALACELNKANGLSTALFHSYDDRECIQSAPGSSFCPPAILHFAKTRKLSAERSDLRNRSLLHKRQFFHSHRAQPMEFEQVLSDRDSEDEIDDDVADLEDQRMLDDFVDVTRDEKQLMHMWNSFVRRQRVLADGHIPWACEAFSRLHSADLVQNPTLSWCWRLFMIKLWNHCLLDARTMNLCNLIIEQLQLPHSRDQTR